MTTPSNDPRIAFQNKGPFKNGMPFGDGVVLNPGNVLAGGTSGTLKHNLGRIPTMCLVLDNGIGVFKGDTCFATVDATNCTVKFEVAATSGTTWLWVR